jgi:hypothetical protein
LSSRQFGKLITALRREGAGPVRKDLPLEDRVLLVAAYWRTNLTLRQLAPRFRVSKSAADRIIDHLGPSLALQQRKRFRKDTRSSSAPTPAWSSPSADRYPATATTARHGNCPE